MRGILKVGSRNQFYVGNEEGQRCLALMTEQVMMALAEGRLIRWERMVGSLEPLREVGGVKVWNLKRIVREKDNLIHIVVHHSLLVIQLIYLTNMLLIV